MIEITLYILSPFIWLPGWYNTEHFKWYGLLDNLRILTDNSILFDVRENHWRQQKVTRLCKNIFFRSLRIFFFIKILVSVHPYVFTFECFFLTFQARQVGSRRKMIFRFKYQALLNFILHKQKPQEQPLYAVDIAHTKWRKK